ncbi:MAG TPA: hypothetical protein VFD60_12740, partial [Nitrososphaeraceae archaeon]|nr:hypothetical protein [Nitrososphaeraceae archaeon]
GQCNVDILAYQYVSGLYLEVSKSFITSLLVINFNGGMTFSFSISFIIFTLEKDQSMVCYIRFLLSLCI